MKTSSRFIAPLVAAALLMGLQTTRAEHEKDIKELRSSGKSASELIGMKVVNAQDETLGKVHDIIINVDAGTASYAVISQGGTFSPSRNKVAVPLSSLQCSADGKTVSLDATKEQLQSATKTRTGEWATVADSEWTRNVDAFYGQPTRDRYARDNYRGSNSETNGSRTFVRDPAPKGAELLMTPQDSVLCEKISENLDVVNVRVQNGVTHIYGTVDSDDARKNLESKVRSVQGVNAVESHLRVKNQ